MTTQAGLREQYTLEHLLLCILRYSALQLFARIVLQMDTAAQHVLHVT